MVPEYVAEPSAERPRVLNPLKLMFSDELLAKAMDPLDPVAILVEFSQSVTVFCAPTARSDPLAPIVICPVEGTDAELLNIR